MTPDREEKIRQRAYELWEAEGRPDGKQQEHWDRAVREINAEEEAGGIEAAGTGGNSNLGRKVQTNNPEPGTTGSENPNRRSGAKRGRNTGIFRPEEE